MSRTNKRGLVLVIFLSAAVLAGTVALDSLPLSIAQTADTEDQQTVGEEQQQQEFSANLSGDAEVPSIPTNATGTAALALNEDADEMSYSVEVEDIEGVTMAHVHQGSENENGDVVVWLFNATEPTDIEDGTLEEGDFTAEDFVGPLQGQNMTDLVDLIQDGQAYINVHTESNPPGEIRGTIELGTIDDTTDDDTTDDDTTDEDGGNGDENN